MSRDTPVTPYTRPPVSTDSATRNRSRDCRNLRQSTAICHILPYPAIFCLPVSTAISAISATSVTSAEFCQVYRILPSSARTTTWSLFCPVHVLTKQPSQRYIPLLPVSLFPFLTQRLDFITQFMYVA